MLHRRHICEHVLTLHKNVLAAVAVKEGKLVYLKTKHGVEIPPAAEMGALMFQRSLVHGLLKAREEYVGRMHYNLTVYDKGDILHFGFKDTDGKEGVLLVAINPPYDRDQFVAKVLRLLSKK